MIRMTTGTDAKGRDFAAHAQHRASSCAALARLLVAEGVPDQPWRSVTAAGTPSLRGPSLHRVAGIVAEESSLRWRRWRPFGGAPIASELAGMDPAAKTAPSRGAGAADFGGYGFPRG
jgi:hypothetical protein